MIQRRNGALPPKDEVRVGTIIALPAILRNLGVNPVEVLGEIGVDIELFDDPDNRISYAARGEMLAHCVNRTGCHHLGLLIGQQDGLKSLGLVGLLVRYSPDVRSALLGLTHFFHLHVHGAVVNLEVKEKFTALVYKTYQPGTKATDQVGDGAVAAMFNIMHELCGSLWMPSEVCFAHSKPEDIQPYQVFFQAPLIFDAESNAVIFTSDWLSRRLPHDDPDLLRLLQKQVNKLEISFAKDLPGQVRSLLRTVLLTQHASIKQVAELLSMHSRTLSRHLNAHGTSFQSLVDEGRYEIARQMLKDTRIDVSQIASILNYADTSSFIRAFRRWSGVTPGQWRDSQQEEC